jgi:hypothetical protein
MSADAAAILAHLQAVGVERERRAASATLLRGVTAIKGYQQRRFAHTYADLLGTPRYGGVACFFLDELYGPHDFTQRDAQLARVVPALVRLFPQEIVDVVRSLVELHALSERLDSVMATQLVAVDIDAQAYIRAWRMTGDAAQRERQIALTLEVGNQLDRVTRKPLLRQSLRLMRGPAKAAGLSQLQVFLEAGFDTFRAMRGAEEFLAIVAARERALAAALFDPAAPTSGQLP